MKRIVKFSDGTYGIRYGFIFHKYQDFKDPRFTWFSGSLWINHCKTTYEEALKFFNDKGFVVEVSNSKGEFK